MIKSFPKYLTLIAISAPLLLSGCATSSSKIAASYVSPAAYHSLNCEQLVNELTRLRHRSSDLAANLDKAASNDAAITAVGAIIFWPVLFALGGNEQQEKEFARLKGEHDAVRQAMVQKNCAPVQQNTTVKSQEAPINKPAPDHNKLPNNPNPAPAAAP